MVRQYLTISILTLAQILFLGHSIIPHQHEDHNTHHHGSHENHDHEDSNKETSDFVNFFFDFNHAENSNDFLANCPGPSIKKVTPPFIFPIQESVFRALPKFYIQQKAPPENCLFNSFYVFLPSGLRGPPNTIV